MTVASLTFDPVIPKTRTKKNETGPDAASAMGGDPAGAPRPFDGVDERLPARQTAVAPAGGVVMAPRLTNETVAGVMKTQEKTAENAARPKRPDPTELFLNYMKKSVSERYIDAWLAARRLTKEAVAAMSPEDRRAVMKMMEEDIKRQIKEDAEKKTGVPLPLSSDQLKTTAAGVDPGSTLITADRSADQRLPAGRRQRN